MARAGSVTPKTLVWKQGLPAPVAAGCIRGLFESEPRVDVIVETEAEPPASRNAPRRGRLAVVVGSGILAIALVLLAAGFSQPAGLDLLQSACQRDSRRCELQCWGLASMPHRRVIHD